MKGLQVALMQAVVYGYAMVVEEAGTALNDHFVKMSSPPGGGGKTPKTAGLDFVVMMSFKVSLLRPDNSQSRFNIFGACIML